MTETELPRTLYDLAGFDRSRLYIDENIPAAAGFIFREHRAWASAASREDTRSFSRMLVKIVNTPNPPEAIAIRTEQMIVIGTLGNECIGMSIMDPADSIAFDNLTWVDPLWRHRGLATAMKIQAIANARKAGVDALWAPSDADSISFYERVGLRSA